MTNTKNEEIFPQLVLTKGEIIGVIAISADELLVCMDTIGIDYYSKTNIEKRIYTKYKLGTAGMKFFDKVTSPFIRVTNGFPNYSDLNRRSFLISYSIYIDKNGHKKYYIHSLIEDEAIHSLYKNSYEVSCNEE